MSWSDAARAAALRVRLMKIGFSATHKGRTMRKTFRVLAADNYAAMDMVEKRIGAKKYAQLTNKVFRFDPAKKQMSARLARVLRGAGPDED